MIGKSWVAQDVFLEKAGLRRDHRSLDGPRGGDGPPRRVAWWVPGWGIHRGIILSDTQLIDSHFLRVKIKAYLPPLPKSVSC